MKLLGIDALMHLRGGLQTLDGIFAPAISAEKLQRSQRDLQPQKNIRRVDSVGLAFRRRGEDSLQSGARSKWDAMGRATANHQRRAVELQDRPHLGELVQQV